MYGSMIVILPQQAYVVKDIPSIHLVYPNDSQFISKIVIAFNASQLSMCL